MCWGGRFPPCITAAKRKRDSAQPQTAKRKRDSAQPQTAKRKRDSAQPQTAKRKRDSAQPQTMTARSSLIPGKARGHSLWLRAVALALRGPRLQFAKKPASPYRPCAWRLYNSGYGIRHLNADLSGPGANDRTA